MSHSFNNTAHHPSPCVLLGGMDRGSTGLLALMLYRDTQCQAGKIPHGVRAPHGESAPCALLRSPSRVPLRWLKRFLSMNLRAR
jgi:hypothetical protein